MADPRPRKPARDRHGRQDQTPTEPTTGPRQRPVTGPQRATTGPRRTTGPRKPGSGGPRWAVGPPKVIPMPPEKYDEAIRAWTALLANWHAQQESDTE